MRLEGLDQLKNPMNSSKLEPATFRLVAQCINQLRYRVLLLKKRGAFQMGLQTENIDFLENGSSNDSN
jgi:uncharacterized protein (DUF488 family)